MKHFCSIVIPMHNEEESAPGLYAEVAKVANDNPEHKWEFLFVDDGSKDETYRVLAELQAHDVRVRAIKLKRNFGQTPAMKCGIDLAAGDIIITMDGDLQNDPADIPRLIEKIDEGYDVVCGWRFKRQDKLWSRKVPSLVANRLIAKLTGVFIHDNGCSLKAYRSKNIKETPLYAEFHRFIPALSTLTGSRIAELKVNHRARQFGETKYNLTRTWRVSLDMFTVSLLIKFSSKPLRFFGTAAIFCFIAAMVCIWKSWEWYIGPHYDIPQVLPGIAMLGIWLSGHLLFVGMMAELCLATAHSRPDQMVRTE